MSMLIMRELSGKKKQSGKSGHKRSDAKHKSKARRHDDSRSHHAHASGARGEGGRADHGRGHAGHHVHHVDMSRIEHHIVRGINLLGLLVEWGLNRNFRAGPSGGPASQSHQGSSHQGASHGGNAGWSSPGYAPGGEANWQARNPAPPPPQPGYSGAIASGRIVVCTGKNCRSRWESGNLIADLQREAAMRGVQVEITSCGCMDFCDEAPLVTVGGRGGYGGASERYFADVGSRDVPNIVASAMSWRS